MKLFFCILSLGISLFTSAQTLDSLLLDGQKLLYHSIPGTAIEKKGLVIYMHGGVSQFQGLNKPLALSKEALLEENGQFLVSMSLGGYDVLLPIAYNSYNWLEEKGEQFIYALMDEYAMDGKPVYIAGFSDGGTGAYRMFYRNPEAFEGLLVFNGFPQLDNFQKLVDYSTVTSKTVIFAGTLKDKRIPAEFLMVEYRRQQMLNKNTFLLLRSGKHAFGAYNEQDFNMCLDLMAVENTVTNHKLVSVYPPLDALVINGEVFSFYSFRKGKGKAYGMLAQEYERTDYSFKEFSKMLKKGNKVRVSPLNIDPLQLENASSLTFTIEVDGTNREVELHNWLNSTTW